MNPSPETVRKENNHRAAWTQKTTASEAIIKAGTKLQAHELTS